MKTAAMSRFALPAKNHARQSTAGKRRTSCTILSLATYGSGAVPTTSMSASRASWSLNIFRTIAESSTTSTLIFLVIDRHSPRVGLLHSNPEKQMVGIGLEKKHSGMFPGKRGKGVAGRGGRFRQAGGFGNLCAPVGIGVGRTRGQQYPVY